MNEILKFGLFEVDFTSRQLSHEGRPVPLTPKVFQTLEILLRNRDRIVSKRELLATIWPECHVEESNLTQNISVLRKALGETNSATKLVATFPRQGYRFIGEVDEDAQVVAPPAPERAQLPIAHRPRRLVWASGLVFPLAILLVTRLTPTQPAAAGLTAGRAVTHLPGRAFQPALSPDGSRLAFVSHQDLAGPLRIGVIDLANSSPARMISTAEGDVFSPAWSPDGRRLAYLHAAGRSVTIVLQSTEGEGETLMAVSPQSFGVTARQLDWSPDGQFLAVSVKSAAEEPFRIELVNLAERRKTVLTTPPELSDGDFQPRFSPDGSKLAFVRQRSIGEMIPMYVSLPGGDPLAVSDSREPIGDIDWTPDSRSILFTPDHAGRSQLWQAPLSSRVRLAKFEPLGPIAAGMLQFTVSRLTGRMAIGRGDADMNIWKAAVEPHGDLDGWQRLVASAGEDSYPTYSPDGRRLAFISDRSGDAELWIKEADGREQQLTFGDLKPGAVSWTGRGDVLVFPALRKRTLYRIQAGGGAPEPIAVGETGAHTAVSPDGTWVYLARRFLIMRASAAGGPATAITDHGGFPLRLSADGQWIYYVRHRFSSEIWRMHLADGSAELLTDRLWPGCWGCWAVNGNSLVYIPIGDSGGARLARLDLQSREVRDLGRLPGRLLPPLGGMLTLSADSLAVVVAEPGGGDVRLLETTPWGAPPLLEASNR